MTTTNQIKKQIKEAIARSISHTKMDWWQRAVRRRAAYIVHITIDGDTGDALSAIEAVRDVDTETDYTMCDYEGVDTMNVWGSTEIYGAPGRLWTIQTTWQLAIRFAASQCTSPATH